jgi:hypothetical protein
VSLCPGALVGMLIDSKGAAFPTEHRRSSRSSWGVIEGLSCLWRYDITQLINVPLL